MYLSGTLILDANILRDSVLMMLELHHFEAFIHCCATMWVVVFDDLRALTNGTVAPLNPLEINNLYEKLWEIGDLLQSQACMDVLKDDYRPWGRVRPDDMDLCSWEDAREARKPARITRLQEFR